MPDYLSATAKDVWFEEIERVVAHGITAADSSTFARYCSLEAANRATFAKGEVPRGAYMSEVRKLAEILGIAGPSSRLRSKPTAEPSNPFAALPEA